MAVAPLNDAGRKNAACAWRIAFAGVALCLAVLAAYGNSLTVPFLFDDIPGIENNASIRDLRALGTVLLPPPEAGGAAGRPVVNLTLALNRAFGGSDVRGYHAANLLFHALAALALFGLTRRTLLSPVLRERFRTSALPLAFGAALLWALHPLQTDSVTGVIQRSELLGALFYLLTLYAFARAIVPGAGRGWSALCVGACLLGMASKEFVVSAPLLALLYDRTFVAGSFRAAWTQRRGLYLALGATWALLAFLVLNHAGRGGTVGFGLGVSSWDYALTQCRALGIYFARTFWPHPLVLDYGAYLDRRLLPVLPQTLLVLALLGVTVRAIVHRSPGGVAGALFFAVLAPSSSVVPLTTQTIAEHRMYLPLAAPAILAVLALHRLTGRHALACAVLAAGALGLASACRNRDYNTPAALWTESLAHWPGNPRAHTNLGRLLAEEGDFTSAIAHYEQALRAQPNHDEALVNLGHALAETGRLDESLAMLQRALLVKPQSAGAHLNLGATLDRLGRTDEARRAYEEALRIEPRLAQAHRNLGDILSRLGQWPEALQRLDTALALAPQITGVQFQRAVALAHLGRMAEAEAAFAGGERIQAADPAAHHNWANALAAAGRTSDAVRHYEIALARRADLPDAHYNFARALASLGRLDEARRELEAALRANPEHAAAHNNLGNVLMLQQRDADAIAHYETSLRLRPDNASTHHNLGVVLARTGRMREAVAHFEMAVRLAPDHAEAQENLARAQQQLRAP